MAAPAIPHFTIFSVISRSDLAEVQRRVEADPSVMEEQRTGGGQTPLMWAIYKEEPAIALWLIQHRDNHDVSMQDESDWSAIHYACLKGSLEVAQQLVAAGADVTAMTNGEATALMLAAGNEHADIVAFLLPLPAVHDGIDSIDVDDYTALSGACFLGNIPIVRLLLDAGANPTIPQGDHSPLSRAAANNRHDIVALLTTAIAEPQRPRLLFKARSIVDASFAIRKAQADSVGRTRGEVRRNIVAAAPDYLQGRVGRGEAVPQLAIQPTETIGGKRSRAGGQGPEREKRRAVLAYTLGLAYGEKGDGLPREVFVELMELMVSRWDAGVRRP